MKFPFFQSINRKVFFIVSITFLVITSVCMADKKPSIPVQHPNKMIVPNIFQHFHFNKPQFLEETNKNGKKKLPSLNEAFLQRLNSMDQMRLKKPQEKKEKIDKREKPRTDYGIPNMDKRPTYSPEEPMTFTLLGPHDLPKSPYERRSLIQNKT